MDSHPLHSDWMDTDDLSDYDNDRYRDNYHHERPFEPNRRYSSASYSMRNGLRYDDYEENRFRRHRVRSRNPMVDRLIDPNEDNMDRSLMGNAEFGDLLDFLDSRRLFQQSHRANLPTGMDPLVDGDFSPRRQPKSSPVRPRPTSSPVRPRPSSDPIRPRPTSSPVRPRQTSSPVRPRSTSGPVRTRPTYVPVRHTREFPIMKKFTTTRQDVLNTPSPPPIETPPPQSPTTLDQQDYRDVVTSMMLDSNLVVLPLVTTEEAPVLFTSQPMVTVSSSEPLITTEEANILFTSVPLVKVSTSQPLIDEKLTMVDDLLIRPIDHEEIVDEKIRLPPFSTFNYRNFDWFGWQAQMPTGPQIDDSPDSDDPIDEEFFGCVDGYDDSHFTKPTEDTDGPELTVPTEHQTPSKPAEDTDGPELTVPTEPPALSKPNPSLPQNLRVFQGRLPFAMTSGGGSQYFNITLVKSGSAAAAAQQPMAIRPEPKTLIAPRPEAFKQPIRSIQTEPLDLSTNKPNKPNNTRFLFKPMPKDTDAEGAAQHVHYKNFDSETIAEHNESTH